MLPQIRLENSDVSLPRKVYVNPRFNRGIQHNEVIQQLSDVHSNQQGHVYKMPSIHVNPEFLQRRLFERQQASIVWQHCDQSIINESLTNSTTSNVAKVINKSRTTLVREPISIENCTKKQSPPDHSKSSLISVSKRKVIRYIAAPGKNLSNVQNTTKSVPVPLERDIGAVTSKPVIAKYKIDRRCSTKISISSHSPLIKTRRKKEFVGQYALSRASRQFIDKFAKTSSIKCEFQQPKPSINKTPQLLNINGVLYKTTKNKLQRKSISSTSTTQNEKSNDKIILSSPKTHKAATSGRTFFVRGTKFIIDPKGFKLTRVPGHSSVFHRLPSLNSTPKRIDIGGLTYVASSKTKDTLERTTNHVSRAHVITAKQRSLQFLNRPLVKTNMPCAIYQRLGKCVAFERGKCRKTHNKLQVTICPSFLRGECNKSNCLLSHDISLSKMPVCKFYLQGICVRDDCPYLHKKLSDKAEICADFIRGYCPRAEKCNKRHEFLCPEYERHGKCDITGCIQCAKIRHQKLKLAKKKQQQQIRKKASKKIDNQECSKIPTIDEETTVTKDIIKKRYFDAIIEKITSIDLLSTSSDEDDGVSDQYSNDDHSNEQNQEVQMLKSRVKLGTLPAYIPLS